MHDGTATAELSVRRLAGESADELFITATPPAGPPGEQAADAYAAVAAALRSAGAHLFQERLFATPEAVGAVLTARAAALGELADAVPPVVLLSPSVATGPVAGVQVHAVRCADWPTVLSGTGFQPVTHGQDAHATRDRPVVIECGGAPRGRVIEIAGVRHVALTGLTASGAGPAEAQTRMVFEQAADALAGLGGDLGCVARTWLWLDDILGWYDRFNGVRNEFFRQHGLAGPEGHASGPPDAAQGDWGPPSRPGRADSPHCGRACPGRSPERGRERGRAVLPASTGIGLSPADGARCALDVRAVIATAAGAGEQAADEAMNNERMIGECPTIEPKWGGRAPLIQFFQSAGRQDSAFRYGSAFSRAAWAIGPAGWTLFISGTAAIDAAGRSCHPGDPAAQIAMTLANVRAILDQFDLGEADVTAAIAYCKSPQVERAWRVERERLAAERGRAEFPAGRWPCITVIADVCRDELLFELELAAARP